MIEVVYFFGDSFVAGFGDPTGHGWIGRVQVEAPDGLGFAAVNRGVPGATSADALRNWQDAAERLLAEDATDAGVVFSFGTNDVITGMPPGQSAETLAYALTLASSIGMPAFVVGPPPIGDLPEADRRLSVLSHDMGLMCAMHATPFVDVHDDLLASSVWMSEISVGDGSHPQKEGYGALAELVVDGGFFDWLDRDSR